MRLLGIDYGQKRTGLAITDASESMAFPYAVIPMRSTEYFLAALSQIIAKEEIKGIVIGLPLRLNGEESPMTQRVRGIAKTVQKSISLPVYLIDESLTSFEAEQQLMVAGHTKKTMRDKLDQAAAMAILNSFLSLPKEKRVQI